MKIDFKFSKAFVKEAEQMVLEARKKTSSDIFVHIDLSHEEEDDWERAEIVFDALNVADSEMRNNVLIYVSMQDNALFIMGDTHLNETVPDLFFEDVQSQIIQYFKFAQFGKGITEGIQLCGIKLADVFPLNGFEHADEVHVSIEE